MIRICPTLSGKSKFVHVSKSYLQTLEKSQTVSAKSETKFNEPKINESIYVNNELKRTLMTQIRRIFTDNSNPRVSAQSAFYCPPSAFICIHLRLIFVSLNYRIREIQRNQSIATLIFASFAVRILPYPNMS